MVKPRLIKTIAAWFLIGFVLSCLAVVLHLPNAGSVQADFTQEIFYDDGVVWQFVDTGCPRCGDYEGVRFSPPVASSTTSISAARFYYKPDPTSPKIWIHVMDPSLRQELVTPVEYSVADTGWQEVQLPSAVTVQGDFWIVIQRSPNAYKGGAGYDVEANYPRSFTGDNPLHLYYAVNGDLLIRAVVQSEFHVGADQPFKTIQSAVDAAPDSGINIIVHGGTYVENVVVNKPVTIQSQDGAGKTIVQASKPDGDVFKVTADNVTISGFTVQQNARGSGKAGIYLDKANQCRMTKNIVSNNDYGILLLDCKSITLSGNTMSGNDIGIELAGSYCAISSNTLFGNNIGIEVADSGKSNNILSNNVYGNSNALWIRGTNNRVTGNNIHENTGTAGSAIHLTASASGNLIHFNKIVANSDQASGSQAVVNENSGEAALVTLNWWGDASGPYHPSANAGGLGDVVGDYVDFQPWLGAPPVAVKNSTATGDPPTLDAKAEASAMVIKTGSGTPFIWVASFSDNPTGIPLPTKDIGKWIDVHFNSTSDVQQVEIRLYYTPDQITGVNEGSLRLYWWDGSAWKVCSVSGVNKTDHYIWARITASSTPTLDGLTGTPFAGGTSSGGFHWWLIPVVVLVLLVVLVIGRLFYQIVIKGSRPR